MRVVNKITFEAKDDAEALRLASERLGKDAVVLSSRPVKVGGIFGLFRKNVLLVSAGILEDDLKDVRKDKSNDGDSARERLAAFQKLLELRHATEMNAPLTVPSQNNIQNNISYMNPMPNIGTVKDIYQPSGRVPNKAPISDNAANRQSTNTSFGDIRGEVNSLSEKLADVIKKLNEQSYAPESNGQPEFSDEAHENIYRTLLNSEMSSDYAKRLINEYINLKSEETFENWLTEKVNVASADPILAVGGRKIAFIGPTGVGKTTTIAKLAAIFSLWEHKKVLLLTSDTYRIAAVEQLRTYAKILGIPTEVIYEPDGVNGILENYEKTDVILLDTAGRNQKDTRHIEAFSSLFDAFKPDAIHLVLAANMKYKDMLDVIDRVSSLDISHLVFTKLDETTSYGSVFDIADKLGKPFSFFTAGQNVPNDIEVASGEYLCKMIFNREKSVSGKG
ncbi:MAG: flagellar biosynthesis protein FlhF [Synergistaceae bacterium]|nr:flagellar biosynthesis protein FlhF [Synergistaceae bacterium]